MIPQTFTLYLRREPSTDPLWRSYGHRDVCAYRDEASITLAGRFTASYKQPRKGCKTVVLNCVRWRAVWLPDLPD
jgi:hypothetical protein